MKSRGFTLVELLTTIGVIAILSALLFPVAGRMMDSAKQTKCVSNLRQVYQAMQGFANDNDGLIVRGMGEPGFSVWSDALASYVGMNPLTYGHPSGTRPQKVFACPASTNVTTGGSRSDFGSNFSVNGDATTPPLKMTSLQNPARTLAFIDSGSPSTGQCVRSVASWMGTTWGIDFRHGRTIKKDGTKNMDGSANVLYFDGHVVAQKIADIPIEGSAWQKLPWNPAGAP
jgi:general secretion pathway protein G